MIKRVKILIILLAFPSLLYAQQTGGINDNLYVEGNTLSSLLLQEDILLSPSAAADANYFYNTAVELESDIIKYRKGSILYNIDAAFKIGSVKDKYILFDNYSNLISEIYNGTYYSLALSFGMEYYVMNDISLDCAAGVYNSHAISKFDIYLPIINDRAVKTAHEVYLNLLECGLAFSGKYRLSDDFQLFAGVRFGLNLLASYDHHINILSDDAIYQNGSKEKVIEGIDIKTSGGYFAVFAGASYKLTSFQDNRYSLALSLICEDGNHVLENNSKLKFYTVNLGVIFTF